MSKNLFALSAVALTVLVSGQAFAEGPDKFDSRQAVQSEATYGYPGSASSYSSPESFRIIRLNELNRSERASLKASSAAQVEAVQSSIPTDVASELRAHGVQINNVVGAASSFSGKTIYYVR